MSFHGGMLGVFVAEIWFNAPVTTAVAGRGFRCALRAAGAGNGRPNQLSMFAELFSSLMISSLSAVLIKSSSIPTSVAFMWSASL